MNHTTGPLQYDGNGRIDAVHFRIPTGHICKDGSEFIGGLVALPYECGDGTMEGNARRFVACWNACNGIPSEYLEDTKSWESAGVMAVSLMVKRCDDLQSACKEALESGEDGDWQSARKVLALAITNRNK